MSLWFRRACCLFMKSQFQINKSIEGCARHKAALLKKKKDEGQKCNQHAVTRYGVYLLGRVGHTSRDLRPKNFFFLSQLNSAPLWWPPVKIIMQSACWGLSWVWNIIQQKNNDFWNSLLNCAIGRGGDAAASRYARGLFYHVNSKCIRCGRRPGAETKIVHEMVCKLCFRFQPRAQQ